MSFNNLSMPLFAHTNAKILNENGIGNKVSSLRDLE